jgi:hypothetical protein
MRSFITTDDLLGKNIKYQKGIETVLETTKE